MSYYMLQVVLFIRWWSFTHSNHSVIWKCSEDLCQISSREFGGNGGMDSRFSIWLFVLCVVVVLEFSEVVHQFQTKMSNGGMVWKQYPHCSQCSRCELPKSIWCFPSPYGLTMLLFTFCFTMLVVPHIIMPPPQMHEWPYSKIMKCFGKQTIEFWCIIEQCDSFHFKG